MVTVYYNLDRYVCVCMYLPLYHLYCTTTGTTLPTPSHAIPYYVPLCYKLSAWVLMWGEKEEERWQQCHQVMDPSD